MGQTFDIVMTSILVGTMLAVSGYYSLRHFRDIKEVFATMQDGAKAKSLVIKRSLFMGAALIPMFSWTFVLTEPWPSLVKFEILNEPYASEFSFAAAESIPSSAWRLARDVDLRTFTVQRKTVIVRAVLARELAEGALVGEIGFLSIRRADVALFEDGQSVLSKSFGLDLRQNRDAHRGLFWSFDLPPASAKPRVLYARVQGEGVFSADIRVYKERDFVSASLFRTVVVALTVGAFLGILIYNLSLFVSVREAIYFYYLIYQTMMLAFICLHSGVLTTLWPSLANESFELLARLQFLALLVIVVPVEVFYTELMASKVNFPWAHRAMRFMAWAPLLYVPLCLAVGVAFNGIIAFNYIAVAIFVSVILLLPMVSYRFVYYSVLSSIGLALGTVLHILSITGILPSHHLTESLYLLGAVWESILLSIAVGDKLNSMRAANATMSLALRGDGSLVQLRQDGAKSYARNYVPREWNVSIMFINIPDFERYTERIPTSDLYEYLAHELREVGQIVREHRGAIDRSLGDGLLCYFGYEDIGKTAKHAQSAYLAAVRIQQRSLQKPLFMHAGKPVVFPYCIGINTAKVLVANLATDQTTDITMIGSGVNFASRLNAVCSPFRILVSESFKEALSGSGVQQHRASSIYVTIKHQEDLVQAFEFHPLADQSDILLKTERAYMELLGYSRRDGRLRVLTQEFIEVETKLGRFSLSDFSLGGCGIAGGVLISQRSVIELTLCSKHPEQIDQLIKHSLHKIKAEVRWCRAGTGRFEHGLRYVGLNSAQKELILRVLTAAYSDGELGQSPNRDLSLDQSA